MRIIVWNCLGIESVLTVSSLKEQVRLQTPDIVVLLETKNRSQRYGYLKRQLGMQFMHAVEPRGLSGGLCLFWKEMSQCMQVLMSEYGDHNGKYYRIGWPSVRRLAYLWEISMILWTYLRSMGSPVGFEICGSSVYLEEQAAGGRHNGTLG
ncbi:unnamed protein product [Prunus armeniaca]|uniref:Endonuclease/exonuclease/phosphatase domain-containing protein n=1 Tax=Prunus armeniaca TaxID=36596 RepID=A0A6J5UX25_PRUAR|nr:unnamed protein product [Prunus armeniaca]